MISNPFIIALSVQALLITFLSVRVWLIGREGTKLGHLQRETIMAGNSRATDMLTDQVLSLVDRQVYYRTGILILLCSLSITIHFMTESMK